MDPFHNSILYTATNCSSLVLHVAQKIPKYMIDKVSVDNWLQGSAIIPYSTVTNSIDMTKKFLPRHNHQTNTFSKNRHHCITVSKSYILMFESQHTHFLSQQLWMKMLKVKMQEQPTSKTFEIAKYCIKYKNTLAYPNNIPHSRRKDIFQHSIVKLVWLGLNRLCPLFKDNWNMP